MIHGMKALHLACVNGHISIILLLLEFKLERGVDIYSRDYNGLTWTSYPQIEGTAGTSAEGNVDEV